MRTPKYRTPVIPRPELLEIVKDFDIFADIQPNILESFIKNLAYDIEKYEAGSLIIDADEPLDYFGFIIDGEVSAECNSSEKTLTKGDDVGLVSALSSTEKSTYKYSAKTDCTIMWTKPTHYVLVSHFVSMHSVNMFTLNLLMKLSDEIVELSK